MSKHAKAGRAKTVVYPLRVGDELAEAIREVGRGAGLSDAAIMRLSIERGLPVVRRMFSMKGARWRGMAPAR